MQRLQSFLANRVPESAQGAVLNNWVNSITIPEHKRIVQSILDLPISNLAKYLFIYASHDDIHRIVSNLSPDEWKNLLKDLLEINLDENNGRRWAYNQIRIACWQPYEDVSTLH